MVDNVSWPPHSNDRFCIWRHLLNHICVTEALHRPQSPQIWCYIMVNFLNHKASILSERGLRCGAVYHQSIRTLIINLFYKIPLKCCWWFWSKKTVLVTYLAWCMVGILASIPAPPSSVHPLHIWQQRRLHLVDLVVGKYLMLRALKRVTADNYL